MVINMRLALKIENAAGDVLGSAFGEDEVIFVYDPEYRQGDQLVLECDTQEVYLVVQLDDGIPPAFAYLRDSQYRLPIPFGEKNSSYSPRAFAGERHVLSARSAAESEIRARKNLALNPLDSHENTSLFPHASANVETRGEAVFAARNAIDGVKANNSHGPWPYQSWGINQNPYAEWKIEFGREVLIDEAVFYLRSDFPHDAWWKQVTLSFSDSTHLDVLLEKTSKPQKILFSPRTVHWILLHKLLKADDPSPFPALTQVEFYGVEI